MRTSRPATRQLRGHRKPRRATGTDEARDLFPREAKAVAERAPRQVLPDTTYGLVHDPYTAKGRGRPGPRPVNSAVTATRAGRRGEHEPMRRGDPFRREATAVAERDTPLYLPSATYALALPGHSGRRGARPVDSPGQWNPRRTW